MRRPFDGRALPTPRGAGAGDAEDDHPVAEILFNEVGVEACFMEWDSERAGGFEPLRFVPKGEVMVLGLVTTKTGAREQRGEILRRIYPAAKYVPLGQLRPSP